MIHTLLNLTRPFFIFDCETTGTDVQSDRIIELGSEQWSPEGLVAEGRILIDPCMPIPNSDVHHITDGQIKSCRECGKRREDHPEWNPAEPVGCQFKPWPTFVQAAGPLAKKFSNCDFGGKNIRFDLGIMLAEFDRASVPWSIQGARIVDSDQLERLLHPRSLSHLYEKYKGKKLDNAHSAMADVKGTTEVICEQLQADPTKPLATFPVRKLPRDLDELHKLQFPDMIDLSGKFRFKNGVACFSYWGKHAGKPMKSVDGGYWDFILNGTFAADVKQLARDAKLGKFPVQR